MGQEENIKKSTKWEQVNEKERYKIEALTRAKVSTSEIARQLGRDRRTIQREIRRGKITQITSELEYVERYYADVGQRIRDENDTNKGRGLKIGHCHGLAEYLEKKIVGESFSPDAALGRIAIEGRIFGVRICTKTLYNYIDTNVFSGISNKDLPVKRNKKKKQYRRTGRIALNNTKGRSIEERQKEIDERKEMGHWEMDCVKGSRGSKPCLLVLTERRSRKQKIFKIKAQTQACVIEVLDRLEKKHKEKFAKIFKTITVDNGGEFLFFDRMEASILSKNKQRTMIYYAHPYSAWERGSNEAANKLIRRFIPKGASIAKYSYADIRRIEHWMNHYPRRIFKYHTANEIYSLGAA